MSDPEIPDCARRGSDLIARIDELAKQRGIDPTNYSNLDFAGNGWIYLLIACRTELLNMRHWKETATLMIPTIKGLTEALQNYQRIAKIIEKQCDATEERRG